MASQADPSGQVVVLPATLIDIPTLARISDDAMESDRHTQMKAAMSHKPYDMEAVARDNLKRWIPATDRAVVIKAMIVPEGKAANEAITAGWACWGWRGLSDEQVQVAARKVALAREQSQGVDRGAHDINEATQAETTAPKPDQAEEDDDNDPVKKIEKFTGANMQEWMEKLMPPGTKCMFFMTLSVASQYQRQGVGSALARWGNELADELGVFIWVHSSEGAWQAYARAGFEVVGTFEFDLDEWATCPPPEGDGAKWGRNTFRYMKRLPQGKGE